MHIQGETMKRIHIWLMALALTLSTGVLVGRKYLWTLLMGLSPTAYDVGVQQYLKIPMRDGIYLIADHHFPQAKGEFPTILIRGPYGRRPLDSIFGAWLWFFAERGYHVLVQDTRGRFDSEGEFTPYFHEKQDGQDTLAWLREQTWFNGELGMWGPSYLGLTQWVLAEEPEIKALQPSVTASNFYEIVFPDGSLDLSLTMRWMGIFWALDLSRTTYHLIAPFMMDMIERKVEKAFTHLPLAEMDKVTFGERHPFVEQWLDLHPPNNTRWLERYEPVDFAKISAPIHLMGGWYDFFLRGLLEDYHALVEAGHQPYLTIGPWFHFSNAFIMFNSITEALAWFDSQFKDKPLQREAVRIYVMGLNKWREMPVFPPPSTSTEYYLHVGGDLSPDMPEIEHSVTEYTYDPMDPTPIVGGTQFSIKAGAQDNFELEARPDVLIFTCRRCREHQEIIGFITLVLYVKSSCDYTDFYGRLCDVHPDGRSFNICEGLFRVTPEKGEILPDGSRRIEFSLWATAYHFKPGHALRLQVSSGAHPRWNRNLGTGDPLGTEWEVADQTIYHDANHPSMLILPVVN